MPPRVKNATSKQRGKGPAEPSYPPNPYGIRFRNDIQATRYSQLVERRTVATKYMDKRTLEALGLHDDVMWMFEQIRAQKFFQLTPQTYLPLVLEFLSSFDCHLYECSDEHADGEITFRLANEEKKLSLIELRNIFQLGMGGRTSVSEGYAEDVFWNQITQETSFTAMTARASKISNPCIKYAHRVLAHTVFGRGDSDGMVRQTELYFLWSMLFGCPLDVIFFFVKHLEKVSRAKKGAIVIGGFITPIALYFRIEPYGIPVAKGSSRIDMDSCIAMKMIIREGDGFSLVLGSGEKKLPLPCPEKTTVKNQDNWSLGPEVADYAMPPPISTVPPPPWGSNDDPFGMGMEQPSQGPSGSSVPPGASTDFQSTFDPGFRYLSTQMYRQELRVERLVSTVNDIRGSVGQMQDTMSHVHQDIEYLSNYMEEMGNFLYERFDFQYPRRSGDFRGPQSTPPLDPRETTPTQDTEVMGSDDGGDNW